MQQARNLYNARKRDKGILSAYAQHRLLPRVNILANKWWVRPVPAAAVTPAPRVAIIIIGSKAFVACFSKSFVKLLSLMQQRAKDTAKLGTGRGVEYAGGSGKML